MPANVQQPPPLISVVIPLFNREGLVCQTLQSVAGQSFRDFEVLVVDDGSTDSGPEKVAEFCKLDRRFRLILRNSAKRGASVCRNIGLSQASGKFILFLDSDDLLSIGCIQARLDAFTAFEEAQLVVAQGLIFTNYPGDQKTLWNVCNYSTENAIERFLNQDMPWANGAALWRKDCLDSLGGWNSDLRCFQDWELHLRACIAKLQIRVLPKPDFFIRRDDSGTQISSSHNTPQHVQSRLLAFDVIIGSLIASGTLKQRIRLAARGLLLRNYLDLNDGGCPLEAMNVLKSESAREVLTRRDRWALAWIRTKGESWRWNTRVRRVTELLWKGINYDSVGMKNTFMRTAWDGEMPNVGLMQDTLQKSHG